MEEKLRGIMSRLKGKKYVLLILLLGLALLLLPTGEGKKTAQTEEAQAPPGFSLEAEEARLCASVQALEGVEAAQVLLALESTAERELAETAEGPLVVSGGSSGEQTVELRYRYPEYRGAVVLWQGTGGARTQLDITQVTAAFTGLSSDKITVKSMEKQ